MANGKGSKLRDPLEIARHLKEHPYAVLAGAIGVGFVLGGGLFTRLTAKIVGAGLRVGIMAALPALQREVLRQAWEGVRQGDYSRSDVIDEVSHAGA